MRPHFFAGAVLALAPVMAANLKQPETRTDNVVDTLHGVKLTDPYRWLEDQQSPETRAWLEKQIAYTRSHLDPAPGREALAKRLGELVRTERVDPPVARGGRQFYRKRAADQEQFVLLMRENGGAEQVLIDPLKLSADGTVSVKIAAVSEDGKFVAYGIQQGGKDERTIRVLDVDRRVTIEDTLPEEKYIAVAFGPGAKSLFYTTSGKGAPSLREHRMGQAATADKELFGKGYQAEHILACDVSADGRFLMITVWVGSSGDKTELWVKDLTKDTAPRSITPEKNAAFFGDVHNGVFYAQTNWNAPNGRVMSLDLAKAGPAEWRPVVPESKSVLQGMALSGGHLVLQYLEDVQSKLKVYSLAGKMVREVVLPGIGSVDGLSGRADAKEAFFEFASFHIPTQILKLDAASGKTEVWHKLQVPLDPSKLEVRQVFYRSKDGTRVPMFLVHKKGLARNGNHPALLTGYGGFNLARTPGFSASAVAWAEQGGVYALANLRGGSEYGEKWHEAGMLGNKQNVFDDFIAAAEFLISEKYTKASRLGIQGGSNGGLLVGAAMTQRPELFGAVLCGYPLLDMVRYHKFLVARFWVPEYGSSEDAEQFRYLVKYSPYHNVKKGVQYPPTMIYTGDGDTRVDPLHGRKMAALLQNSTEGKGPILLHYDVKSGHSDGRSATKTIDDLVDQISFLSQHLGVQ